MRFQSAALVAALASGAIAAPSAHHKHMQLHAAREAEAEAFDYKNGIDWNKVSITGVNWATVDYNGNKGQAAATSIAAAPAAVTSQASAPVAQAVENKVVAPASHAAQSAASSAAAPSSSSSGGSNLLSNVVDSAVGDVKDMVSKLSNNQGGVKVKTPANNNGFCQVGQDGSYVLEATNKKTEDMILVIWNHNAGYQSSFVGSGVEAPVMTVGIPAGKTQHISFKSGASGAMAPVWAQTAPSQFGQISNTWLEFTFTPGGTVDVSREVNMNGDSISALTSDGSNSCTTDMNQCSFHCNSGNTCGDAGTYKLVNCSGPLAQSGFDTKMGGSSGGCGIGNGAKSTVKATFG